MLAVHSDAHHILTLKLFSLLLLISSYVEQEIVTAKNICALKYIMDTPKD